MGILSNRNHPLKTVTDPETSAATGTSSCLEKGELGLQSRRLVWVAVIVLGLVQCWHRRYNINPDGVSYLDVGDAYFRGDWHNAINAWWSPFYSWLLGAALFVTHPAGYWEIIVIKAVNFLIYLVAWWATDFLVCRLLERHELTAIGQTSRESGIVAARSLFAAALCLFLLCTREWIPLAMVSPDLSVYAVLCVGMALMLRIYSGQGSARTFAMLGLVLGIGYLVKTILFPIGIVFLLIGWAISLGRDRGFGRMLLASTIFLAVALPFIAAISFQKGRFTFGDSGRVNYIWMQNRMGAIGQSPEPTDVAQNPSRRDDSLKPSHFEAFASPVAGTDPLHYDPSYWAQGAKLHFSLAAQCRGLARSLLSYQGMLLQIAFVLVALVALLLVSWPQAECSTALFHQWPVFVVGSAGLGLYALVLVEERYVAGFVILVVLGLFAATRLPGGRLSVGLDRALGIAIVTVFTLTYGPRYAYEIGHATLDFMRHGDCPKHQHTQWEVAKALGQLGILRGDRIGTLFVASDAYYARLAGVRIVAQLAVNGQDPDFSTIRKLVPESFTPEGGLTKGVLAAFSAAGAKAVVAREVPSPERRQGWVELGATEYYALPVTK